MPNKSHTSIKKGTPGFPTTPLLSMTPGYSCNYLDIIHLHAGAFFANKDIINIYQDVAVKGEGKPLASKERNCIYEDQFVQPKVEIVAKEDPLDAIMEAQVLDHSGMESCINAHVWNGFCRLGLGQEDRFIGGMVRLEDCPILPWKLSFLYLAGTCDIQEWRFGIDAAVFKCKVGVEKEWEAFQLSTEQAVLVSL